MIWCRVNIKLRIALMCDELPDIFAVWGGSFPRYQKSYKDGNTYLIPCLVEAYAAINLGNKDSWLGELLYTMIVNRMNPYALDELMQGKITFDDAVFKEAAEKIKELNEHHAFPKEYMNTGEVDADAFTKEVKKILKFS